ncbi:hypothetical protein Tco_1399241, partial [Tanacetum coccineum]
LNIITKLLKDVKNVVKDDPVLNKKVIKATKAYTKNSSARTELLNLVKNFNFQGLKSLVESLKVAALRQDEHLASWAKSSNSLAWNLGPKMTAVESSQAEIRSDISSLNQYTSEIKSMMMEIFQAFKGQSSAPSSSVSRTTLAITKGPANVGGRMSHRPTLKNLILTLRGSMLLWRMMLKNLSQTKSIKNQQEQFQCQLEGKAIVTDVQPEVQTKLVHTSNVVREDPDEPIKVPYMIIGKMHYLTNDEINAYLEKEDKIKNAAEEAKMFKMTKTEVIKVV